MNYLLDTHALIWYGEGSARLPQRIRAIIADPQNQIFVSHSSIWEMAIKMSLGKLTLTLQLPDWENLLRQKGFTPLLTSFRHFEELLLLSFHHQDPFDRLLIAQAIAEDFTIITHDPKFHPYPVKLEFF
jgi:PIN domain nuclease of toxin-antitoxin system